jgi:hypothetical protein
VNCDNLAGIGFCMYNWYNLGVDQFLLLEISICLCIYNAHDKSLYTVSWVVSTSLDNCVCYMPLEACMYTWQYIMN